MLQYLIHHFNENKVNVSIRYCDLLIKQRSMLQYFIHLLIKNKLNVLIL